MDCANIQSRVQITTVSHLACVIWLCVLLIVLYRLSGCRGGKQIATAVAVILTNGLGDSYWYKSLWSSHAVILRVFALFPSKSFINLKSISQRVGQKRELLCVWGVFLCIFFLSDAVLLNIHTHTHRTCFCQPFIPSALYPYASFYDTFIMYTNFKVFIVFPPGISLRASVKFMTLDLEYSTLFCLFFFIPYFSASDLSRFLNMG